MIENIVVRICSTEAYERFIGSHSEDYFFQISLSLDSNDFISGLASYNLKGNMTLEDLAKLVWSREGLLELSGETATFRKVDGSLVDRKFYCYQMGVWAIPLSKRLIDLHYSQSLVLVYWEERHLPNEEGLRLNISLARNKTPGNRTYIDFVRSSFPDTSTDRSLKAVILPSQAQRPGFVRGLRQVYPSLVKASKSILDLIFLENSNENWAKSHLDYWNDNLRSSNEFQTHALVGYTSAMPYSHDELLKMLPDVEGIKEMPQMILYRDFNEGYIVLDIDVSLTSFFESVLRTLYYVNGSIKGKVSELKGSIESRLEMVELPAYQSKPGSKARMQEALSQAKEKKRQEALGKIAPENVYKEIERVFKVEGKELESFHYFKEKFLTWYPEFQRRKRYGLP